MPGRSVTVTWWHTVRQAADWEADLDRGGRSVLAIHPLLWVDGWPVAGEPFKDGVYEISSVRRGYALELAVDFVRHDIPRSRFWMIDPDEPVVSYPNQTLEEVAAACRVCVQQRQLQVGV